MNTAPAAATAHSTVAVSRPPALATTDPTAIHAGFPSRRFQRAGAGSVAVRLNRPAKSWVQQTTPTTAGGVAAAQRGDSNTNINTPRTSHGYIRIHSDGDTGKENHQRVLLYDPFRPHVLAAMADARTKPHTPVSTNNPDEYASRFRATKTQKPKVVAFDGMTVSTSKSQTTTAARGVHGFFPPVKLRMASDSGSVSSSTSKTSGRHHHSNHDRRRTPPFILELAPESAPPAGDATSIQTVPARIASGKSGKSGKSGMSKVSHRSNTSYVNFSHPVYPHVLKDAERYDDLSFVPKPKMMVSRDNPWVYRFKVKKSMNELSKVMASKPPASMDYTFIH